MTPEAWLWISMGIVFVVLETRALILGDTPEHPRTLTANVRALINGRGWINTTSRLALVALLAWLPGHFLG